jgi:hypothetical protein
MSTVETVNVGLHVAAGVTGLLLGLVPLATAKGGPVHRRWGRRFSWVGLLVLSTAVVGDLFFGSPMPLVAATLSAGYQGVSGVRSLALKGRGPGLADAVLALAALAGCGLLLMAMGPGTASWRPSIGYSTVGFVASVALYDLSRHAWAERWSRQVRPLDHGLKMTGAYFAMMSAGVGNVFRHLQPWSQVLPSALGMVVMLFLAAFYRGRLVQRSALTATGETERISALLHG